MMNMTGAITGTVIMVILLIICVALFIKMIGIIQESNQARAKIKERRYLGFSDYIDTILLSILLCLDVAGMVTIIYFGCKLWGVF